MSILLFSRLSFLHVIFAAVFSIWDTYSPARIATTATTPSCSCQKTINRPDTTALQPICVQENTIWRASGGCFESSNGNSKLGFMKRVKKVLQIYIYWHSVCLDDNTTEIKVIYRSNLFLKMTALYERMPCRTSIFSWSLLAPKLYADTLSLALTHGMQFSA